jgi:NDP-sugar pyrophosphorylase family protein
LTNDTPKGLVPVAGKPLLQWVIEWLRENGVSELVIGVAHLKEKIIKHFGSGSNLGVNITYSVHTVEGGTGEAFRLAISRYVSDDIFFALNGDQITDLRLGAMARTHFRGEVLVTIATARPRLPFGLLKTDEKGYCTGFEEKPVLKELYCSSGIYIFDKAILRYIPQKGDVERTAFPRLVRERRLMTHRHNGSFLTVNSVSELEHANLKLGRKYR